MKIPASLLLFIAVLGGASASQASSFKYTVTFDATSHSGLTSYSLVNSTLITSPTSFLASHLQLLTPPAAGATFLTPFPAASVNGSGGVTGLFTKGAGSSVLEWQFSGLTAPLKGPGDYPLLAGSTSYFNGDALALPVKGSVVISSVPSTESVPEPRSVLLLGAGMLLLGTIAKRRSGRT